MSSTCNHDKDRNTKHDPHPRPTKNRALIVTEKMVPDEEKDHFMRFRLAFYDSVTSKT